VSNASIERQRIAVAGADDVLRAFVALRGTVGDGVAAARALAKSDVAWRDARDEIVGSARSVILAEGPEGCVLGAKWLAPGEPTTIHDHGHAGATLVVEGRSRYERFERVGDTAARLESIHDLATGDVGWWGDPPDDVHRQTGSRDGAIELVLVAGTPVEPDELTDATPGSIGLRAALTAGLLDGRAELLVPWYADDVLLDVNVPQWRFQVRGRDAVVDLLRTEELDKPDRRASHVRVTDTAEGLVIETEVRFTDGGALRLFREVHLMRCRGGLVVEHTAWCSGISGEHAISAQLHTAPMERM
jgi:hypothetical protein